MIKKALPILVIVALGSVTAFGAPPATPQLPVGVQSSFDVEEATVRRVFSSKAGQYRFVAYLIEWKGTEVIVSDPLGRSEFKVGDKIRYIAQKTDVAKPQRVSALNFTLTGSVRGEAAPDAPPILPAEQERISRITQGDLDAAENETERFWALNQAAKKALAEGKTAEAQKLATELKRLAPMYRGDWNYGNAVQDANHVLGRIALAKGNVAEAKKCLLASADSNGSPQMNSFGPNMQLAKDLLAKGKRDVVLQYFKQCGKFWTMGADRLAAWTELVNDGQTPEFGSNLQY